MKKGTQILGKGNFGKVCMAAVSTSKYPLRVEDETSKTSWIKELHNEDANQKKKNKKIIESSKSNVIQKKNSRLAAAKLVEGNFS